VVDCALALIDREGIEAATMRRVGRELGVEGMALYTHVRDKADLLDAVAERVLEGLDVDFDRGAAWQERIRRGVLAWAALQEAHPRAFPLVYRGGVRTESVGLLTEELLDALRTAGFDERGAALAYQTVIVLIDSALLDRSPEGDAGFQEGWARFAERVDPRRYPRVAEVGPRAATLTWAEILDSAVDLLLRGLEARLNTMRRQ
jgi:AcrR family transcriptional regulator